MMPYLDKTGVEIKAGIFLRMEDGSIEKVYACSSQDGTDDLGINASNEAFLRNHYPGCEDAYREFYSLSNFRLSSTEICQPEQVEGLGMELGR